jgi:IS1 family transposase
VVVATRADEPRRIAAGDAVERASLRVRHELARTLNKKRAMTVSIVLIGAA